MGHEQNIQTCLRLVRVIQFSSFRIWLPFAIIEKKKLLQAQHRAGRRVEILMSNEGGSTKTFIAPQLRPHLMMMHFYIQV